MEYQAMMNEESRWAHLVKLDDELLKGGVAFSEWCTFVVKDADIAFANGAYLSAIVMGLSAMETYLRSEANAGRSSLYELIETSDLRSGLKDRLHELRKFRNKWVHVNDPNNDEMLLEKPEVHENEIEKMALISMRAVREILYSNQFV